MDNKDLQDRLVDYLYGELETKDLAAYEAALRDAPEVREEIAAFERTRELFGSLDEVDVPSAISDALVAEAARVVPEAPRASFLERLRRSLQLLVLHPAMSAAVVMVAVFGVSLYVYRHSAPPTGRPQGDAPVFLAQRAMAHEEALSPTRGVADKRANKEMKRDRARSLASDLAGRASAQEAPNAGLVAHGMGKAGKRPIGSTGKFEARQKLNTVATGQGSFSGGGRTDGRQLKGSLSKRRRRRSADRFEGSTRAPNAATRPAPAPAKSAPRRRVARRGLKGKGGLDDLLLGGQKGPSKAAAPKRKKVSRSQGKSAEKDQDSSAGWLRRGHKEVAAGRCAEALNAYARALRADGGVLSEIDAHLGACRPALARSASTYPQLHARLYAVAQRRAARRARTKRVRTRKTQTQRARPKRAAPSNLQAK
ncbi:MAG: hypothetical protein KAI47_08025 [Deltaproteobacteria bacterium]|nr:hypothetical protein [Deltaproteobacteria bacterium]